LEKSDDKITIRLHSPSQFQAALDAVVPVLAALHSEIPGVIKGFGVAEKNGDRTTVEQLNQKLDLLIDKFENIPSEATHKQGLLPHEEMIVAMVEAGPRKLFALALERWFRSASEINEIVIHPVSWSIYENYIRILSRIKSTLRLQYKDTPKQLPPSAEKGVDDLLNDFD
jgi:hypothetical protein